MAIISKAEKRKNRFFNSIRLKILITYLSLMAAALAMLNTYPLTVSRELIFASKHTFMQSQAALISTTIGTSDVINSENVFQLMGILELGEIDMVVVTNNVGTEVYRSASRGRYASESMIERGIHAALANNDYFYSAFTDGIFKSCSAMPITKGGVITGTVFIYEYDSTQGTIILNLQNDLQGISIVLSAFALLLGVTLSMNITKRITGLLSAISYVREGEYTYRIPTTGNDELSELGEEFNSLTRRLQKTEEVRRQFVADASHELKTPLASIRLLTDSILQNRDMDKETIFEFVSDIDAETWRLTRTTEKLQMLTRIDNKALMEYSPIDVKEIVLSAVRVVHPIADSRGIRFFCELADGCTVLATDEGVYQIVQNLVENSVKYNVENGSVYIGLKKIGNMVLLSVEDTGIGIPKEDMAHIFDRFYRVDKARSREAGGSGLGLSIVKSTTEEFGGTVTVEAREVGGSLFTVILPYANEDSRKSSE